MKTKYFLSIFYYDDMMIKNYIIITYHSVSLGGFENNLNNESCAFEWSMCEIYINETIEKILWAGIWWWWQDNRNNWFNKMENNSLTTLVFVIIFEAFQKLGLWLWTI